MVAVAVNEDLATVPAEDASTDNLGASRSRRASAPLVTGERYQIGQTIGRGGMGEVLSAFDTQVGREVAIKRMNDDRPTLAQGARFLREARIQGRLQHPAIPPVHEIAADRDGRLYFVMTKLTGVTLAEILRAPAKHPGFTRQRMLRAFVEVCHAIEVAHASGVVHRDLKPANVLLGERGEVYVLDWGIARELDRPDYDRDIACGTPGYMSPEQARGDEDVDARADVFALGCVLYEILTGQPLFRRPSSPRPDLTERDEVPPELELACLTATYEDRQLRLGSVKQLSEAVKRYLDGDRDHERRRVLAARHLAAAQTAMASLGHDETRRRVAMREAGRALALDPTLLGAAELVGRMMLSPPGETPKAVVTELAALDRANDRKHLGFIVKLNVVTMLLLIPVLIGFGVHDVFYLSAYTACAVGVVGCQIGAFYSERFMKAAAPFAALLSMFGLGLLARMFSPLLLAPGFAAVSLMSFGLSAMARERKVIVSYAVASIVTILAVWAAEPLGLLSRTVWIEGATLVLRSPMEGAEQFPVYAGMIAYVIVLISCAGAIANLVSSIHYTTRLKLQTQSWQLRQLL